MKKRPDAPWFITSWFGEPVVSKLLKIWVSKNRDLRPKGNPFVLPTFPIEEVKPWPKFIWICDWCGEDVGGPHTPTCPHCAGPRPMHWRKQVVTK